MARSKGNLGERHLMNREDRIKKAFPAQSIDKIVAERMARDLVYQEGTKRSREAVRPILEDLARVGYKLNQLWDLKHQGKSWAPAIPVLLRWLPLITDLPVKEEMISCLSVSWTGNRATRYLIEEFRKYAAIAPEHTDDMSRMSETQFVEHIKRRIERNDPSSSVAWTIANALSIVDVKGFEKEIIKLCRKREYGIARQMIVMALHRLHDPEAEEVALDLLSDPDVRLHAIIALGKMKSKRALFQIEKLLADKQAVIRKEARKAITKINRV